MTTPSTETQIALLAAALRTMESDLKEAGAAITALQEERNRALKWGITSLGIAVLGMASWIFNTITGHIK